MIKLWYNDPKVLLDEPFQFIPTNDITEYQRQINKTFKCHSTFKFKDILKYKEKAPQLAKEGKSV